jgi:hypothetical protein
MVLNEGDNRELVVYPHPEMANINRVNDTVINLLIFTFISLSNSRHPARPGGSSWRAGEAKPKDLAFRFFVGIHFIHPSSE